ncbi:transcriptional coactivator p15/PC4 family protein [Reyranella sp.]|uniref:transcriptional coactivator p15/PC4 family protein n=1 Tax=Reyranella sp. TaxID=1929291 RepID=UPI0037840DDD
MTTKHVAPSASAGKNEQNEDILIADIVKNERRGERIRVADRTFKRHRFIDIRLHVANAAGEVIPTGKGIAIPPALLPEVIEALTKALAGTAE